MTDGPGDQPATEQQRSLAAPSLVEDVLLLLFQPRSGTIAGENTLFYVLGGAVLAELALTGRAEIRSSGRFSSAVHVLGGTPPEDELLRPAWGYAAQKPRNVQTVLAAVGPELREPVLDRLVERGDLNREERKTLGIFRTTRLTEGSGRRQQLLDAVRAVLVGRDDPTPRTAAAAALLSASGMLPQFDPEIPWGSRTHDRGKELEQGSWGASAAAAAVTRTTVAIVSASVSTSTTTLPGS
ncbi:GOLPH3/VPS74 family protein [Auraticoccus monumenti]|uniref:Golgi phosphoprotein 3 (GPP34) n=1 Tax=Auraticoccus monumenti TaxID=675864 RepID=A0A1G6V6V9_9ACTN|nr:GPP34 family phosphoprotein [Auraticoccus monumenti]SDD49409.1 Golgi phosphoprotein 3 (GPP34) [Auraticoccus monumenti]